MNLTFWEQQLVNGIINGSGYACVAVGWTILLGTAKLVNFAHGTLYMFGAFVIWYFMSRLGMSYLPAALCSVLLLAVIGVAMQGMLRELVAKQKLASIMIVTLGIGYMLQGLASILFSGNPQNLRSPLRPIRFEVNEVRFTAQDIAIVVVTLLMYAAVWTVRNRTRVGAAVIALSEDAKLAQLFGIDTNALYAGIFAFECASVAVGAALVAPRSPILTSMGFDEVIMTFVVVVVGGVGSVVGALVAGMGLGIFIAIFSSMVSSAYALAAAFGILLLTLMLRPQGLARR
jgi:branched-chain amino acid transport system permease protein